MINKDTQTPELSSSVKQLKLDLAISYICF